MTGQTPIDRNQSAEANGPAEIRRGHIFVNPWKRIAVVTILWCLSAGAAAAQYTVLGGSAASGMPSEEAMRTNVEEARWSSGPFRVQPWLGLQDLSYVRTQQNVSGGEEGRSGQQLTVTVGAGLRAYAPVGSKVVWAAHLLPEYVWWQNEDAKSGLNGRYGMGFFGYANRLQFQLSHRVQQQQSLFSDEVQELTTTTAATSTVGAEFRVLRGLHVYASWDREDFEGNADDDAIFTVLDRVEDGWSAGFRLRSHRGWSLGLGVRQTDGTFDAGARDFSFESEALTVDLGVSVRKFDISLDLEDAELTPSPGSLLEPLKTTLGHLNVGFQASDRLGFQLYAQRQRSFSVVASRSLIVGQEQGLRVQLSLGTAWSVRLLVGTGTLDTEGLGDAPDQSDSYDLLGASLGYTARRFGTIQIEFIQRSYDTGILGGGRDVSSIGLSVNLGELTRRLSVGDAPSQW